MLDASRQPVPLRTVPKQQRSRERFEHVLDTAEALLADEGYAAFTTTAVAARAGLTQSTVYRWFADKDELAAAILARHNQRIDALTRSALAALESPTLDDANACVYGVYVDYYRAHRSHVILWFGARGGATATAQVHEHTARVAQEMRDYAVDIGLLPAWVTAAEVHFLAEVADRVHEYAFRNDPDGDERILARGVALMRAYYADLLGDHSG